MVKLTTIPQFFPSSHEDTVTVSLFIPIFCHFRISENGFVVLQRPEGGGESSTANSRGGLAEARPTAAGGRPSLVPGPLND